MMFDESAHDTGGPFRPQGELPAPAVFEDIHLFFDDVGGFAQGPVEQLQRLEGRRADLVKTELAEEGTGPGFQLLEVRRLVREEIVGSSNRLKFHAHDDGIIRH